MADELMVSASIEVNASPETIFAIVADPHQHPRIDGSGSVKGIIEGPHRLSLGAQFGMKMKLGLPYRISLRVVEFEADRLIAWRHRAPHRWRYQLEPLEDGRTKVTETFDYRRMSSAKVFYDLMGWPKRNKAAIEATLPRLKAAAEADEQAAKA